MDIRLNDLELSVQQRLRGYASDKIAKRIWGKDASVWSSDPATQKEIGNALGWLDVLPKMSAQIAELKAFADSVKSSGFTDAVLIGMGGSSLCPEMFRQTFGKDSKGIQLHVLDTTDADWIAETEKTLPFKTTLIVVASKSGSTVEIETLLAYFWERIGKADQFVAITDPETPLHKLTLERKFRKIFLNSPDIGGRFSALSLFGLVPAALLGMDLERLLMSAGTMSVACGPTIAETDNVGVILGTFLGEAADRKMDKMTLALTPEIGAFGLWIEQLVAESTGKNNTGILPVVGEPIELLPTQSTDRVYVVVRMEGGSNREIDGLLKRLAEGRTPWVRIDLRDPYDLGGEFLRWEVATAVAGHILQIQPFNQPNVQESKTLTKEILDAGPVKTEVPPADSQKWAEFLKSVGPGNYLALLAYLPYEPKISAALETLRAAIGRRTGAVVTTGFGPRYLHSTGQLHKGGPASGRFIVMTGTKTAKIAIPGRPFDFTTLQEAQAAGDCQALARRFRPVLRAHFDHDPAGSLSALAKTLNVK